jgi:hypothetical protein
VPAASDPPWRRLERPADLRAGGFLRKQRCPVPGIPFGSLGVHARSEAVRAEGFELADIFWQACQAGLEDDLIVCWTTTAEHDETSRTAAARRVMAWIQEFLRDELEEQLARRGVNFALRVAWKPLWEWPRSKMPRPRIESGLLREELAAAHCLAVDALSVVYGGHWPEAKAIQLEVSGGRPLAVCGGVPVSWPAVERKVERDVWPTLSSGCGAIFPDAASSRRRPFATYCPDCRNRRRQQEREAEDAVTSATLIVR